MVSSTETTKAAVLEHVLKRDRAVVAASLFALTALAWAYLVWLSAGMSMTAPAPSMPGMDMPGMNMGPALKVWSVADIGFTFAMWAVMMVGMMTPSAAPMILLYARVGRQARAQGKPFAATFWFTGGYLLAWSGFALLASLAQAALASAALVTPMLALTNAILGGLVLIAAGLYQWSPLKQSCLGHCQAPLAFIQHHGGFKRDPWGALGLGLRHGLYCVGCCWALMALLFVGGVMNLVWIAGLSILVLLEKIVPAGQAFPRAVGLVLIGAGAIYLFRTVM